MTIISDNTTGTYPGDYSGTVDTELRDGGSSGTNFSTDGQIQIRNYSVTPQQWTALIKFTGLSNISSGDTVSDATLHLYQSLAQILGETVTLRRVLRNWVAAEATGDNYSTGNAWTTQLGLSEGNDISATVSATGVLNAAGSFYSFTSAQFISDVNDMVQNPSTNYGWLLSRSSQSGDSTDINRFLSSEATDGNRPALEVTHSGGGGGSSIPPGSLSLVGVGI